MLVSLKSVSAKLTSHSILMMLYLVSSYCLPKLLLLFSKSYAWSYLNLPQVNLKIYHSTNIYYNTNGILQCPIYFFLFFHWHKRSFNSSSRRYQTKMKIKHWQRIDTNKFSITFTVFRITTNEIYFLAKI